MKNIVKDVWWIKISTTKNTEIYYGTKETQTTDVSEIEYLNHVCISVHVQSCISVYVCTCMYECVYVSLACLQIYNWVHGLNYILQYEYRSKVMMLTACTDKQACIN